MATSLKRSSSDRLVAGEADVVLTRRRTEPSRQGEVELRHALIIAAAALLLPFVLTATRLSRLVQRTVSVRTAVAMVTAVAVLAAPLTFHASRTGHEDHSAAEMEQR